MSPLPPGPTGPKLVQLARWIWSPIELLESCARKYGEYFTVELPTMPPNVVFTDPAAVRDLFTVDPNDVRVGEIAGLLKPIMGESSVMIVDGARHLRERKLMMPPFHGERMRAYGNLMQQATVAAMARWPAGKAFSMLDEMHSITLEIILNTIIGVTEASELARMREIVTRFLKLGTSPLATAVLLATPKEHADALLYRILDPIEVGPLRFDVGPVVPWREAVRAQRRIDEMFYEEFASRRRTGTLADRNDVLSLLMSVRDEQGNAMTDQELRDEMITLLLAGHETTATTLAWAMHFLLRDPPALERLTTELALTERDGRFDSDAIAKNEFLDAVLKETMRLAPVALVIGRHLAAPMRLGRWDLPAGVNAMACVYLTQRRPDLWERPNDFVAQRWLGRKVDPYTFFPFGGGTRRCLGMAFAYYEMKIVLAEMVLRSSIRAVDPRPARMQRKSITFAPSGGLKVVAER